MTIGARVKRILSAADGMINSFCSIFRISAKACKEPYFPTSIGPRRSCINAEILRSEYNANNVNKAVNANKAVATSIYVR